jgi:hypothetical protein
VNLYVCGYPRSGNGWLARLLGDALDSPVANYGSAVPIAQEGAGRSGPYVVHQLHLKAGRGLDEGRALVSVYDFDLDHYDDEHICHIIRDPRDVAVSAWKYFDYPSLEKTIHSMAGQAAGALGIHGDWRLFVAGWLEVDLENVVSLLRYEYLPGIILGLLDIWGLDAVNDLEVVFKRQAFAAKRRQIEVDGDSRPYGKAQQLKSLRQGTAGDWRNHFTRHEARIFHGYFYDTMEQLGYEDDALWWQQL